MSIRIDLSAMDEWKNDDAMGYGRFVFLVKNLLKHPITDAETRSELFDTGEITDDLHIFDQYPGAFGKALKDKSVELAVYNVENDDLVSCSDKSVSYKTNELEFLSEYYGLMLLHIFDMFEVEIGMEKEFFDGVCDTM